jgi:dCTP deaminase
MTILCDRDIRDALDDGLIEITPTPSDECISTSAVDLRLSREFRRWKLAERAGLEVVVDPSANGYDFQAIAEEHTESMALEPDGSIILRPRDFVLGVTEERVNFPREHRLAARVEGRSSLARLGVGVHVTAPTIHSGFRGRITLEITNLGNLPVKLRPGQRACQLIIERLSDAPSEYAVGSFVGQESPTGRGAAPAGSSSGTRTVQTGGPRGQRARGKGTVKPAKKAKKKR